MIEKLFKDYLANNMDLVIAAALVLVGILVLIISRYKSMPSKGTPYLIGAIVGIIGITVLNRAKAKRLKKEVLELEERIGDRQEEIDEAAGDLVRKGELLEQSKQEFDESIKKYKYNTVSYATSPEEVEKMSDDEIFEAFSKL